MANCIMAVCVMESANIDSIDIDSIDESVLKRAQQGDRDAFKRVVSGHYDQMFRFACKYCGSRQDAEDVTQQACVKLARSISQFRFESAFSSWLYRLVINCARDWYRSHPPQQTAHDEEPDMANDNTEHSIMLTQVLRKVDAMGEGYRETLSLVMGEGLNHAEAAAVLDVKESTISWRLHEIRKRLKAEIKQGAE